MKDQSRIHPLQGATEIVKGELEPMGPFLTSVVQEVWGKDPPFAVSLDAEEKKRLFAFALSTAAGQHDMEARFGKERVAAIAKKYGITLSGQEEDNADTAAS